MYETSSASDCPLKLRLSASMDIGNLVRKRQDNIRPAHVPELGRPVRALPFAQRYEEMR